MADKQRGPVKSLFAIVRTVVGAAIVAHTAIISSAGAQSAPRAPGRYPWTNADVQFMQGMIGHHAQAVAMASWVKSHDAGPSLQIFAGRIVLGQTQEIEIMQQWLRERGQVVPDSGAEHHAHGSTADSLMPGMLTLEQMALLDKTRGVEFERLFLTYMIMHHQGAISMVQKLFGTNGAGQDDIIWKFANDVQADQGTEIERMYLMLDALPAPKSDP